MSPVPLVFHTGSDLIQFIMEDRLGHARGPVHIPRICYVNKCKALRNITDDNLLHQNDIECHQQIIIVVKVFNDAAP